MQKQKRVYTAIMKGPLVGIRSAAMIAIVVIINAYNGSAGCIRPR